MKSQHPQCHALRIRAEAVLAGGPATLSKSWNRYPANAPLFLASGSDMKVFCVDGIGYIDCVAALGPILLGHDHGAVTAAVSTAVNRLASSTLSTRLEVEVAELLCATIPGAELVRFASNGADVTNAAVKLARHVTGRQHMLYCGYHGGHDSYLSTTDKDGGLLPFLAEYNHQILWRDMDAFEALLAEHSNEVAGLLLEVPPEDMDYRDADTQAILLAYMDGIRKAGGLFLLDEVVTGLRYGARGAQGYYSIQADIITMSKAMANGYPCAAILGPKTLMEPFEHGKVFLSTTFGAHPIGLAACKATLQTVTETTALFTLTLYGEMVRQQLLVSTLNARLPVNVRGNYARFVLDWSDAEGIASAEELRTLWLQEMIARGILCGVPWFPMTSWTRQTAQAITTAIEETCAVIAEVLNGDRPLEMALYSPVSPPVFDRYRS